MIKMCGFMGLIIALGLFSIRQPHLLSRSDLRSNQIVQSTCQRHVKHEKYSESNEIAKIISFMKLFTNSGLHSQFHAFADFWDILPTPGGASPHIWDDPKAIADPGKRRVGGVFVEKDYGRRVSPAGGMIGFQARDAVPRRLVLYWAQTRSAAATVSARSRRVWAEETKKASNWEGGRAIPASSRP
jgi:hypothetical protein